ncbi:hypothetical protein [Methylobacterium mesophilicum]
MQLTMRSVIVTDLGSLPVPDSVEQAIARTGYGMFKGGLLDRYADRQMRRAAAWVSEGIGHLEFRLEEWPAFMATVVLPKSAA